MDKKNKKVICFGEVLYDILPSGKKVGGAPMNVAYHLRVLNIDSVMVSRVGTDGNGHDLLQFLKNIIIPTDYCQRDPLTLTGEVIAEVLENNEVSYDIRYPVAWDYISWDDRFDSLFNDADAFVYGSLAARHETTRSTLFRLLEKPVYKVFDVNLRAPYYSKEIIQDLLSRADLVKLNLQELQIVAEWFSPSAKSEQECIAGLQEVFQTKEIIVTKGSEGASYYSPALIYNCPAYRVQVNDTVGSGDSFLAAFLAGKLKGESIETSLDYAAALGAYIATHAGACPEYSRLELERFIWNHPRQVSASY